VILDDQVLDEFFDSGHRVAEALQLLANHVGATPLADYRWEVAAADRTVRHMRRVTQRGMIGVQEDGPNPAAGESWTLRVQIVSWNATPDVAIVRRESALDDGFWEMHVGDGNPRPIKEGDLAAAFSFISAALQAAAQP
jgi:hypothetical protein